MCLIEMCLKLKECQSDESEAKNGAKFGCDLSPNVT